MIVMPSGMIQNPKRENAFNTEHVGAALAGDWGDRGVGYSFRTWVRHCLKGAAGLAVMRKQEGISIRSLISGC